MIKKNGQPILRSIHMYLGSKRALTLNLDSNEYQMWTYQSVELKQTFFSKKLTFKKMEEQILSKIIFQKNGKTNFTKNNLSKKWQNKFYQK